MHLMQKMTAQECVRFESFVSTHRFASVVLQRRKFEDVQKKQVFFTWNKPAYACLATRIPTNERITAEKLEKTEEAENYLFSLGFTDFRVRYLNDSAKIQMPAAQMTKLLEMREEILIELKKYYKEVLLDLQAR